jgi:hypothetical protein
MNFSITTLNPAVKDETGASRWQAKLKLPPVKIPEKSVPRK